MTWPDLSDPAYRYAVERVLSSGKLTEGGEVPALESEFSAHVDRRPVLAVNTGCAALEMAVGSMIGSSKAREVIVPALTFSGSVLPILRAGGIPVVADVDERTFNVTARTADRVLTKDTAAVLIVHLHGLMAQVPYGLPVIEDACQAFGARAHGVPAGAYGDVAAFSLNHRKTVFAGEGGLLACEPELVEYLREVRHYGIHASERGVPTAECQRTEGWNWKLPELSAAVARVSLQKLPEAVRRASYAATTLSKALPEGGPLLPPLVPDGFVHGWHKYRVLAATPDAAKKALDRLRERDVPVSFWQSLAIPDHRAFRGIVRGEADVARDVLSRSFLIGTEDRPLADAPASAAERWATELEEVAARL